jgi:hypothetical protein
VKVSVTGTHYACEVECPAISLEKHCSYEPRISEVLKDKILHLYIKKVFALAEDLSVFIWAFKKKQVVSSPLFFLPSVIRFNLLPIALRKRIYLYP